MSTININVSKTDMGLDNVDNTSDLNKPISTATQTALDAKVDKVTGSRLITSAEATVLGNTSGVNSGDETVTTIKTKLGITTLSGSNTGDQDLSGYQPLLSGGTNNRITKWTSSSTIGNSLIQDDGTTLGVGVSPVSTALIKLNTNIQDTTVQSDNSKASGIGITGTASGSNSIGGSFTNTGTVGSKIGVNGSATGAGGTNKGAVFGAINGATNYCISLSDGTEGVGKFLKSITSGGDANWATIDKTTVGLGNVDNTSDTNKPVSTAQQTALDLKTNKLITENAQTGTSYTLVIGDADKLLTTSNASANTVTIPPNSSVAFSVGTQIIGFQLGAGQTSFVAGSGVTIRSSGGKLKLTGQYSGCTLIKQATDTWLLIGDISA